MLKVIIVNIRSLIILSDPLRCDPDPLEELERCLSEDALHVAHEPVHTPVHLYTCLYLYIPVHIPLASRLLDNVFVVVISQATRQLLIIHLRFVFPESPPSRYLKNAIKTKIFVIFLTSSGSFSLNSHPFPVQTMIF